MQPVSQFCSVPLWKDSACASFTMVMRDDKGWKVFVGNLPPDAEGSDLRQFFRDFGQINDCWIARKPPGFGFAWFDSERDARDAVKDMDGRECLGNRVRVELSNPRGGGRGGGGPRGGGGGYGGGYRRNSRSPRRYGRSPSPRRGRDSRSRSPRRDRRSPRRSPYRERSRSGGRRDREEPARERSRDRGGDDHAERERSPRN